MTKITPFFFLLIGILLIPLSNVFQNDFRLILLIFSVLFLAVSIYLFFKQLKRAKK